MYRLSKEELIQKATELEEKVRELEKSLSHDKLTALKNRGYFEEKSKAYLQNVSRIKKENRRDWMGFYDVSFLFFDIDHFKSINDTYGHSTGDAVLQKVADTLKKSLRVGDVVARWGGEEFIAILLGSHEEESRTKAEEIRKSIESLVFEEPKDLKVTISIGVAEFSEGKTFEDMVNHADEALYEAKETGRNRVVVYSEIKK